MDVLKVAKFLLNWFFKPKVRWLILFGQFTMTLIKNTELSNIAPNAYCMVSEFVFTNYTLYKLLAQVLIFNNKTKFI